MRILFKDLKQGIVKVVPESSDDLWVLSTVIAPGDLVTAKTVREIRFGERGSGRSSRIPMVLTIRVEAIEFQPFTNRLRIRGVVVEGPEKYGVRGKHHTLSIDVGRDVTIVKEQGWPRPLLERLEKASQSPPVVVVAVDYDEYAVAVVRSQGVRVVVEEALKIPGKGDPRREDELRKAVAVIAKTVARTVEAEGAVAVVVAGPGPLKDQVVDRLRGIGLSAPIHVDTASIGGVGGVYEAIRRGAVARVAEQAVLARAEDILATFDELLAKNPSRVAYGLEAVERAVEACATESILVLDALLHSFDAEIRNRVYQLLTRAGECRTEVHIVPLESPAGVRVKALGGVVAVLRYAFEMV